MLHPLEHVRNHQNPLANTPALASCQAPQLGRPRFAAEEVCWHRPSPKHGTLAYQLYHIWGSLEAGIRGYQAPFTVSGGHIALCFHRTNPLGSFSRGTEGSNPSTSAPIANLTSSIRARRDRHSRSYPRTRSGE